MTRRAVLRNRERLLAVIPVAALAAAQAAYAQSDVETTVVRLGVPSPTRVVSPSKATISRQAMLASQQKRHNARIQEAMAALDWDSVLFATAGQINDCPASLDLWARGKALYELDRQADLQDYYSSVVLRCADEDLVAEALQHAAYQLDVQGRFQVHASAMAIGHGGQVSLARDALLRSAIDARVSDHVERGEWTDAIRVARQTSNRDRLVEVGWALLEQDTALARDAFEAAMAVGAADFDEEARYGYTLAAFRIGDTEPALSYGPVWGREPDSYESRGAELAAQAYLQRGERRRGSGDWTGALQDADRVRLFGEAHAREAEALRARTYLAAADAAYDAGDFELAKMLSNVAVDHPETARAASFRVAWSDLQLGNAEDSGDAFRRLYSEAPDEESAQGLLLVSARAGQLDALGPFARTAGGPLAGLLDGQLASDALARDDFITARRLSPEQHPELEGIDEPWLRQSVAARSTRGAPGEGRFKGLVTRSSASWAQGTSRWEAGVAAISADVGTAPDNANVGIPGQPNADLSLDAASPFARIDTEGAVRLSVVLSTTPIGGAVAPRPTGSVGVERRGNRFSLMAAAFARSVAETITSLAGRKDPATNQEWGRAVDTGAEVQARYSLTSDMIITGGASASVVSGRHIKNNPTFTIETGLAKTFDVSGFEYLSAGPFYQFQSFDHNTNFHTVGHGGYFSPDAFHRAGLGLNLQTSEKRSWIAKLDASIARENVSTSAAPILPLSAPAGARFTGGESSGVSFAATINVARRLGDRWIASAGASAIASEAYDDLRAGVALRYSFGDRRAVVSRDMDPDLFNRDIW